MSILGFIGKHLRDLKVELANKTLISLTDVKTERPGNLSVLQYNGNENQWIFAPPEEIGAVVDGGVAGTVHLTVLTLDGGGA
jgi:hypothetical protein